jgi:serine/threonine protein kinase
MSAPTSSSSVPTVLGYSIREHIASGGMSQVYRALNPITNHLVAIKVIPLDSKAVNAEAEGKKVVREIRIHEVLKHASILQLIGGESREGRGIWPEGLYIVLDLGW